MPEYFIYAQSFAAPFFSDTCEAYVSAESPATALEKYVLDFKHPAGLYAANCYASADAMHKGSKPLAQWLCNHEAEKQRLTKDLGCYAYRGHGPGEFEIDDKRVTVPNPKGGRVTTTTPTGGQEAGGTT